MSSQLFLSQITQLRSQLRALIDPHEAAARAVPDSHGDAHEPAAHEDGFAEAQTPFSNTTQDERRFDESVQLMRAFAAIENLDDRRLLLAAAHLLSQSPEA